MQKTKKKQIRLKICELLDQCDDCPEKSKFKRPPKEYLAVCAKCRIGKELLKLGQKLG
jgi:hypothetical protein